MSRPVVNPVWDEQSEQRVLDAIAAGQTVTQIARAMGHTPNAIRNMLTRRKHRQANSGPLCVKLNDSDRQAQRDCLSIFLRVAMGWDHKTAALEVIDGITPLSMPNRSCHFSHARARLREALGMV